jgi:glycosyltransferase involved in cell wall biosynthesis
VRSALGQSYTNQEIVVVDDGSATPLVLAAELAADPRVRVLRLGTHAGAGEARNVGVRASRGTLLAFLDDDDRWRPQKIESQVRALASRDERTAAVESGYELWDGPRRVDRYLPRIDRDLRTELLEDPRLQPSTVLLRRSVFIELGGFDPSLMRTEDWDLWVRLADSYDALPLPEVHVDREASYVAPDVALWWYRRMVRSLKPRVALLPPRERSRVRATHLLGESALLARLGEPRLARRIALLALRENPRGWLRPGLYLIRSVIGEQAFAACKLAVRQVTLR